MLGVRLNRRGWIKAMSAWCAGTCGTGAEEPATQRRPFRLCLNTSTIRGQNLPLDRVVELVADTGYDGIEPWIDEVERFVQGGGSLRDLAKKIADCGLRVESAIGFAQWIVDDEAARRKGLEDARRAMDMVQQLGGTRIAAPPAGAQNQSDLPLPRIAERYRALLELGERMGVVPMLEVWGFSKTLGRLSEAVMVAVEADHPKACVLADVYHLHKGGSGFHGLRLLGPEGMHVFHINDYPADPPRNEITDAHRVYPGDGVAPLTEILRHLMAGGFRGALSLELFNRDYWKQDAVDVARTGLKKMKAVVENAIKK
ncbi:MAG: sugar phosphate isomerase/epimerase [Gemmataceae bacterium]|nr:sugar phosphate isomerase/epimerase [Gemmataceae bacterium]